MKLTSKSELDCLFQRQQNQKRKSRSWFSPKKYVGQSNHKCKFRETKLICKKKKSVAIRKNCIIRKNIERHFNYAIII